MDNFLHALCRTIWWTLLPPAEPKRFIILQSFPRGSSSEAAVTQGGRMFPLVLSFFFFSFSFLVHVSTWDFWVLWIEFCFRNQGMTSSRPSTSLVTFSVTPKRSRGDNVLSFPSVYNKTSESTIRLDEPSLKSPKDNSFPTKSFHS